MTASSSWPKPPSLYISSSEGPSSRLDGLGFTKPRMPWLSEIVFGIDGLFLGSMDSEGSSCMDLARWTKRVKVALRPFGARRFEKWKIDVAWGGERED
ncbi:Glycosyltransferase [Psidium guajava]|nr:Glycosyltransferase [Psidium guajava]